MEKFLNLFKTTVLKNKQIITCVAIGILLIATLMLLFGTAPKNKFAQVQNELTLLSDSIRDFYRKKPDYWGLNNVTAIKNKIAPADLIRNEKILSSIGREYIIGQNQNGDTVMPAQRNFMITLSNLGKTACKKIAVFTFNDENHFGLQKIVINNSKEDIEFEWGGKNPLPIEQNVANKHCSNKNSVSWVFQ